MRLQLALDFIDIEGALHILRDVKEVIDIVEVGTPFIVRFGLKPVIEIKKEFPDLTVLADLKIMDAGAHEAQMAYDAGADIVTVLGVADDATIKGTIEVAKKENKEVLIDMIAVKDIETRAIEIDAMGADYICVHTAFDVQDQGLNPLEELELVGKVVKNAKTAVAGGIKTETLKKIIPFSPAIVVCGGGITSKKDKYAAAKEMKDLM